MTTVLSDVSALNEKVKLCHQDLDDLLQNLQNFETNYQMPSQEFFNKFRSGSLSHDTDYFEWYAYLELSKKIIERIRELEKELGGLLEREILATA
ncbi:MAG: hypothetical protein ACE5I1_13420 [bacterium]